MSEAASRTSSAGLLLGAQIGGALLASLAVYKYLEATRVTVIDGGKDTKHGALVRKCRSVEQGYWPSIFSLHSGLELLPFVLAGRASAKNPVPHSVEEVELEDGEILQIVWFRSPTEKGTSLPSYCDKTQTPIVMIHHGAMCDALDLPGQGYVKEALAKGWIVCALNRRGHTGRPLKVPKFQFFGSTADVRAIVEFIHRTKRPAAPIYFLGISSGSGLVAKYMGEQGQQLMDAEHPAFVTGAVGVCPGYDIEKCMARMQWPYQQILLQRAKEFFLCRNQHLLSSSRGYCEMMETQCMQAFLDNSYSIAGYRSKDEFYLKTNPMETAGFINQPCLFINARNDPVCVEQNVRDQMAILQSNASTAILLTALGSHCPFYELSWNPFKLSSWAERVSFEYLDQVEQARGEEIEACRVREENLARLGGSPAPGQGRGDNFYSSPASSVGFAKSVSRPSTAVPASPSKAPASPVRPPPASPGFAKSLSSPGGEGFINVGSLDQLNLGASAAGGRSGLTPIASPVSARTASNSATPLGGPWSTVKSPP